jgi:pyruvate kinase
MGALLPAHHLGCKAILALTESGSTGAVMSRHTSRCRVTDDLGSAHPQRPHGAVPQRAAAMLMPNHADRDEALGRMPSG